MRHGDDVVPSGQYDLVIKRQIGYDETADEPILEDVDAPYGIAPADVRYAGSYSMLATLICRDRGFSIDSKMGLTDAETASIAYLPVKRAFHGRVKLAWRRDHSSPAASDFASFLDPGTDKLDYI